MGKALQEKRGILSSKRFHSPRKKATDSPMKKKLRSLGDRDDDDNSYYKENDLVRVTRVNGTTCIGIVMHLFDSTTCRFDNGRHYTGPAMEIHTVDENMKANGTILRWQNRNSDALPASQYRRRLTKITQMVAKRSPYHSRIMRVVSHSVQEHKADRYGRKPGVLNSELDRTVLGDGSVGLRKVLSIISKLAAFVVTAEKVGAPKDAVSCMAYLVGKIVASEASQWNGSHIELTKEAPRSERMPSVTKGQLIFRQMMQSLGCPFSLMKNFQSPTLSMLVTTVAMYNHRANAPPNIGAFLPNLLLDPTKSAQARRRAHKAIGAMSVLHNSTSNEQRLAGPGFESVKRGFDLTLGSKGGTSDETMQTLAHAGLAPDGPQNRSNIRDAFAAIDVNHVRTLTAEGMEDIITHVADNVDWDNQHSVAVATMKIGEIRKSERDEYVNNFRQGFPNIQVSMARDLLATAEDDKVARDFIAGQNVHALYIAFFLMAKKAFGGKRDNGSTTDSSDSLQCDLAGENRARPQTTISGSGFSTEKIMKLHRQAGGRHRVPCPTTMCTGVLPDVSSKSSEAVPKVMEHMKKRTEKWDIEPQTVITDQEFATNVYNTFYRSLSANFAGHESQSGLSEFVPALIPMLGPGHAIKNICPSFHKYHEWFFGPAMDALGYSPGTAKRIKIEKATNIRKGVRTLVTILETHRAGWADHYLRVVGNDERVVVTGSNAKLPPLSILNTFFGRSEMCHSATHEAKVVLDPMKRPQVIYVTREVWAMAHDFQSYVESKENAPCKSRFGPSGYHKSIYTNNFLDDSSARIPMAVTDDLAFIFRLPMNNKYGVEGLVSRCRKLGIYDIAPGRSQRVLAARLYAYHSGGKGKKGIAEAAKISEDDRYKRQPVPKEVNLSVSMILDLLFGSEGCSLLLGVLLTRVREKDTSCFDYQSCTHDSDIDVCTHCGKDKDCDCTHRHLHAVWMKSFTHCMFKRPQKHYQRLGIYGGLFNTLILKHKNRTCRNVAMRTIRYLYAVGNDSYNQEAVDEKQENSNVKPCKGEGRRSSHNSTQLNTRTGVKSRLKLRKDEEAWKGAKLGRKIAMSSRAKEDEWANFKLAFRAASKIIEQVLDNSDPNGTIAGTNWAFADRSRIYYRDMNSTLKVFETAACVIGGFKAGDVVTFPEVPYPPLSRAHKTSTLGQGQKRRNELKLEAEAKSRNALALAQLRKEADLLPDHSMLCTDLGKAGSRKSTVLESIVNLIGTRTCTISPGVFGYVQRETGSRRPFHLFLDASDAHQFIRGDGERPVIRLVDVMKDFHKGTPTARPVDGAVMQNTLREYARNTIYGWKTQGYLAKSTSLLVIAMDAETKITILRTIQRQKRSQKAVNDVAVRSAISSRNPDTDMDRFGDIRHLKGSAKHSFMQLLAEVIIFEMSNHSEKDAWCPSTIFGSTAVAFVGGGAGKQFVKVVYSGDSSILLSTGCSFTAQSIQKCLETVVNQGEGEKMMYSAMYRIMQLICHKRASNALDTVFIMLSEDNDALAGPAMPFLYGLRHALDVAGISFQGRILLWGHKKSSAAAYQLGLLHRRAHGNGVRASSTGHNLHFITDLIAMFHVMENHEGMPILEAGQRACAIMAVYTFVETDYIMTNGLKYDDVFAGLTSKMFCTFARKQGKRSARLLHLCNPTFDDSDGSLGFDPCYAEGWWPLFRASLLTKGRTEKTLLERYSRQDLENALVDQTITYDTDRIATLFSRERPAPDIPSFLSHSSVGNIMVRQWSFGIFQLTPKQGREELLGSSLVIPMKAHEPCHVEFRVRTGNRTTQRLLKNDIDSNWVDFFEMQYGKNSVNQHQSEFLDSLKEAYRNNGFPKPSTVPLSVIQMDALATTPAELKAKLRATNGAPKSTADIFEKSICSRTEFRTRGNGRPLLVSNRVTARVASTGLPAYAKSSNCWEQKSDWPVSSELADLSLTIVFKAIDPGKKVREISTANALKLLTSLAEYVMQRSESLSLPMENDTSDSKLDSDNHGEDSSSDDCGNNSSDNDSE